MTQESKSVEHDDLVRVLANWLRKNHYSVAAGLEGYTKPPPLGDHRPDVWATKTASLVIGEAELCDQLHDQHTEERWKTFGRPASQPRLYQPHEFVIIVPSCCLDKAKQQAADWGIEATFYTETLPRRNRIKQSALTDQQGIRDALIFAIGLQ